MSHITSEYHHAQQEITYFARNSLYYNPSPAKRDPAYVRISKRDGVSELTK